MFTANFAIPNEGLAASMPRWGECQSPQKHRARFELAEFSGAVDGNAAESLEIRKSCDLLESARSEGKSLGDYRFMKRIHRSQTKAYCVMQIYLANEYCRQAPEAYDEQMIVPSLSKLAHEKLKRMKQSLRITSADLFIAQCLDIPLNAPIGELRRTVTTWDNWRLN